MLSLALYMQEYLGVAKGSSISWVAKFKGDKYSACKLSTGRSRNYKVITTASFCREMSGREVTGRYISTPVPWCLVFRENLYGPMAFGSLSKVYPQTGIGPWMPLPRGLRTLFRNDWGTSSKQHMKLQQPRNYDYCKRARCCLINLPPVTYVFLARFAEISPPRARYVTLLGPAQDSEDDMFQNKT